jgi:hypothetical protein
MARILVHPEGPKVIDSEAPAPSVEFVITAMGTAHGLWEGTVKAGGSVRYTAAFEISPAAAFIKALEFARGANLVSQ